VHELLERRVVPGPQAFEKRRVLVVLDPGRRKTGRFRLAMLDRRTVHHRTS
jgi:hypothetical protein